MFLGLGNQLGTGIGAGGSAPVPFLKGVLPGLVELEWDFTKAECYPGTLTAINNLGDNTTDYQGTVTGNPVFTGTAGTSSAYWLMDGSGDRLGLSANNSFLNTLHSTQDHTLIYAGRFIQNDASQSFITTQTGSTGNGVTMQAGSNESVQYVQGNGSAAASFSSSPGDLVTTTDYLIILSHDHATNQSRRWLNSRTKAEATHTFGTGTSTPGVLTVGARAAGGTAVPNGTRIYAAAILNAYIDNAEAALIYDYYNASHGRTYA